MKYYIPDIDIPPIGGLPEEFREQFGGVPFGLPQEEWPKCSECKKHLSLIAQFRHDAERLDLGREGRILYVFFCQHNYGMCETWELESGASVCVFLDVEGQTTEVTQTPNSDPSENPLVEIIGWIEADDGLDSSWFDNDELLDEHADEIDEKAFPSTRVGGTPLWLQSSNEADPAQWRFRAQLDGEYNFFRIPATEVDWVHRDAEEVYGRKYYSRSLNFGMGGLAYLVSRTRADQIEFGVFWQQ